MTVPVFIFLVLLFWLACTTAVAVMFAGGRKGSPYPAEAAEVPKSGIEEESAVPDVAFERARPLTEVEPLVVAGSDLDRSHQPMSLVNLTLRLMVDADPELAAMNAKAERLAGLYVAPEVDR